MPLSKDIFDKKNWFLSIIECVQIKFLYEKDKEIFFFLFINTCMFFAITCTSWSILVCMHVRFNVQ